VKFEPGTAGSLIWTDTWYPGWEAIAEGRRLAVRKIEPCNSQIEIPSDVGTLDLHYQPLYLPWARWLQLIGVLGIGLVAVAPMPATRNKRE
jgi:uncharacterized membrane protein YfhO